MTTTVTAADRSSEGSVRAGLDASLRRAVLLGLAVWQGVMVMVLVLAQAPSLWVLVPAHAAVAALALASTRSTRIFVAAVVGAFGVWFADYLAARSLDDAVTLAACWLGNVLYGLGALTMNGAARYLVPIGGAVLVGGGLVVVDPTWTVSMATAISVTAVAIVVAARLALPALWTLAETADHSASVLEQERAEREAARRASLEAAEDARLVHDTVINTLGAVANGGRGMRSRSAVRARCRSDADVVDALLRGRRATRTVSIDGTADGRGTRVVREGLDDATMLRLEAELPPAARAALAGAVAEALRNVAKHAPDGDARMQRGVEDGELVVRISDDGPGFDPDAVVQRGLRHSVRQRVEDAGGRTRVDAAPGRGTVVELRIPLSASPAPAGSAPEEVVDVEEVAGAVLRRAAWLWSVGVLGVGVAIELANRPGRLTWTYAMLGLVGLCVVVGWAAVRRSGRLGPWVQGGLIAALPTGYLLSMAGIGFGTDQVYTYQAIGISPVTTLLVLAGGRRALPTALVVLTSAAVATAAVLAVDDLGLAAVALAAVAPTIGIALGWVGFLRLVRGLVERAAQNRALSFASTLEARAEREVVEARRRWSTVGLETSAALLRRIGDDPEAVDDPDVRARCAREEQYLRQVLLLSATSYRMTTWFGRALAVARAGGVELVVRSGDEDVADAVDAQSLGELVLRVVESARAGESVTVGLFPGEPGPRLVLVAPAGRLSDVGRVPAWGLQVNRLPAHDVLEAEPAVTPTPA